MTDSRNTWNRYLIPPELADAIEQVAEVNGFRKDNIHLFIYAMVAKLYPEDLANYKRLYRISAWKWDDLLPPD